MASAVPLQWPEGWSRTPISQRRRAPYKLTPDRAASELIHSLKLLGVMGGSIIVSTNIPVRKDGLPYSTLREPDDQGVAVYWHTRAHGERVMACDKWLRVHENIRAIGLAVEGLRAIDRAGASQILERAFSAFGALPASSAAPVVRPWWEVLGLQEGSLQFVDAVMCEAKYRDLARKAHPDQGGSEAAMTELNQAREQMRQHFGGK